MLMRLWKECMGRLSLVWLVVVLWRVVGEGLVLVIGEGLRRSGGAVMIVEEDRVSWWRMWNYT